MPSPSVTLETLRPDLGGSFMEFDLEMNQRGMVATQVLVPVEVQKQAGIFGKVTRESLLKTRPTERAPGSDYNRAQWEFTRDSFATAEHGAEEPVDDREAEMYADYFDAELVSASRARNVVMTNLEQRVADLIQNTGTFNATAATASWKSTSTGVPVSDVEAAVQRLYNNGIIANAVIIPWQPFRNARRTDEVQAEIASSGAGESFEASRVTAQKLAQVFDLERVIVPEALVDSAGEGLAASIGGIWNPDTVVVCRIARTRDIREPCVGRIFHWGADGSQIGGVMESYRDPRSRSNIIRNRMDSDEKVLYTAAAELITGVNA